MTEKRGRKPIGDKAMTDAQRQAKPSGVIVVSEAAYDRAVKCLTTPQKPTQALLEGASLLEKLRLR